VLAIYLEYRGAGFYGCSAAERCLVSLDSRYALPNIKKCVDTYAYKRVVHNQPLSSRRRVVNRRPQVINSMNCTALRAWANSQPCP
jgi:hypothetical protein